jgi:hypothetical protein
MMSNIASPWRYETGAHHTPELENIRLPAIWRCVDGARSRHRTSSSSFRTAVLDAQAFGRVGEAPHFRYRYENEDGFEILHVRASVLFTTERTVSSFPRCLSYLRDTVGSEYGIPHRRMTSVRNYEPASGA